MFYDRVSRRYFLQGLGASLALPFLPSVMPKAYAQTGGGVPMRYVQCLMTYGVYGQYFYPSDSGLAPMGSGIHAKSLSSISGEISKIWGSDFTPFKNKMSILRGMHVLAGSDLHNGSMPTCSSGTPEDNQNNGRPVFSWSIDYVLSQSSKIYPDPTGKQRLVLFAPAPNNNNYNNYSWAIINGNKQHPPHTTSTSALLSKFTFPSGSSQPQRDPALDRKRSIVDGVFEDYKKLRDGRGLASEDRRRLEAYISLIDSVKKDLGNQQSMPVATSCGRPDQESDSSNDAKHRNQINILVAAMACQMTSVASYCLSTNDNERMHTWAHDGWNQEGFRIQHSDEQRRLAKYIAYLMRQMDSITEANGKTMLDNSIVYAGNEYGDINEGGPHTMGNMTAMVAGGGGNLQLGQYIDYRKTGGIPFNNFLISLFNAMGLSSSDYQKDNVNGFGEYNSNRISRFKMENYTGSTSARRTPLPYFYKGPNMG